MHEKIIWKKWNPRQKKKPQKRKKKKNFPRPGSICLFHGQIASVANQKPP